MSIVDNMFGLLSAYITEDGGDSAEKLSVAVEAYRTICESSERMASIGYGIGQGGGVPVVAQTRQSEVEAVAEDEVDDLGIDFAKAPVREERKMPSTLPFGGRLVQDGVVVPNAEADLGDLEHDSVTHTVEVEIPNVDAVSASEDAVFVPDGDDVLEVMTEGDEDDLEAEFGSDTWSTSPIVGEDVPEDGDVTLPPDEYEMSDTTLAGAGVDDDDDDVFGDLSAFDDLEGLDAEVGDDFEDPLMRDLREAESSGEEAFSADDDVADAFDGVADGTEPVVDDDEDEFGIGVSLPSIPTYDMDGLDVGDSMF